MTAPFKLTVAQETAISVFALAVKFIMLFGGSRSGKTFLIVRLIVLRAIKAPGSRHCILRFRFNHIKRSIISDTFPKVMQLCFPDVTWKLDKQDWFVRFGNGSEIWFGGLDDKERTEKVLGNEYVTIYLNECSQISWHAVGIMTTRLAQKIMQVINGIEAGLLAPRMYFDCNPPNKLHWSYLTFIKKIDIDTKMPLKDASSYASFKMNPQDNAENLSDDYLATLEGLSARLRKRFLEGEFADANPNALFADETIDKWRVVDGKLPQLIRVVIAIDPSGSDDVDNLDNDEIGIIVAGLGANGVAYVLEDCSLNAGPATWGNVATTAFDRHKADVIVGEVNYGGAMVKHTIQVSRPRTPYYEVHASRGKAVRADPVSALYEAGKVRHVGVFNQLEEELSGFTTMGYIGARSPNRGDALVWAISALFPAMVKPKEEPTAPPMPIINHYQGRM